MGVLLGYLYQAPIALAFIGGYVAGGVTWHLLRLR
jgi:hypothetical protein